GRACAFAFAVHPELFARLRIERHDGAPRAAGRIDDAVHHQGRALVLILGSVPEMIGLESPRDRQFAEIRSVDLIERRVARVPFVSAVRRPFAFRRGARLATKTAGGPGDDKHSRNESEYLAQAFWQHRSRSVWSNQVGVKTAGLYAPEEYFSIGDFEIG